MAILAFVVVLGTLVVVHELGHLAAAKLLKIKVETFSIGFGKRLFGIRRDDTDYIVSAIPLGGYVQLSRQPANEQFIADSPYFSARPPLHKIIVCVAGPAMNIVLALVLFIVIFSVGIPVAASMDKEVKVGWIRPGSPAMNAGLQPGDTLTKINQTPLAKWQELFEAIPLYINKSIRVEVIRDQEVLSTQLVVGQTGELGLYPIEDVIIGGLLKGGPAEVAGLRVGDTIKQLNGKAISVWSQFQYEIGETKTEVISLQIVRGEQAYTVNVKPQIQKDKRLIGITFKPVEQIKKYSLVDATYQSFVKMKETVVMTGVTFWKLISLDLSMKALGGPIMIAQISGEAAKTGIMAVLGLMAFLSVQLGIFNLIPFIPIVDGGQITLFLIESIRKRPLSDATVENLAKVGWAAMIMLIIVVSYNDIARLL